MIVWLPRAAPTAKLCVTCGAAVQLAAPAWSAAMVQVPTARSVTVPAVVTEQAADAVENATARPDEALALNEKGGSARDLSARRPNAIV